MTRLRNLLTVPANRLDLVAKVGRSQPDAVFLDLEDGVPPGGMRWVSCRSRVDSRSCSSECSTTPSRRQRCAGLVQRTPARQLGGIPTSSGSVTGVAAGPLASLVGAQ